MSSLRSYKNTKLEGKSIKELQKIWSEIEYKMGAKQNLKMAVGGAIMGVKAIEDLVLEFTSRATIFITTSLIRKRVSSCIKAMFSR
jgi:hypothetical protein